MRDDRRGSTGRRSGRSSGRAISDVVGYVLIVALVVSIVGIVSVSGFASLSDARDVEQANNAERAFDVLSDNVADIYEDGAPSRATEVSLTEATLRTTSTVTLNVSANDTDSDDNFTLERTARPVVWEGNRDTEIVYSFGATLRDEGDGGLVVEPPPFRLDTDRTVVPIVQLRSRQGRAVGGSTLRVRAVHTSSTVLLTEDTDKYDELWLNVTTPRADIWQQHLDRYPDTDCRVETKPDGETAVCELPNREALHVTLTRINVELEG